MGVFRQFPYSNFHEMNMDEIIKIIKDMLEEWAQYHAEWDAWMEEINDDWSNYQEVMNEAWQNMQNFINNYFDNLDVQNEINNKIVSMVASGEFASIVAPYIPPRVTEWLSANITQPVGVVIDTSLTVAGACADAKATGDAINNVTSALNQGFMEGVLPVLEYNNPSLWELGGIGADGQNVNSSTQCRLIKSHAMYAQDDCIIRTSVSDFYLFAFQYADSDCTDYRGEVGYIGGGTLSLTLPKGYYYRFRAQTDPVVSVDSTVIATLVTKFNVGKITLVLKHEDAFNNVEDEINNITSELNQGFMQGVMSVLEYNNPSLWELGGIGADGQNVNNSTQCRLIKSHAMYALKDCTIKTSASDFYMFVFQYADSDCTDYRGEVGYIGGGTLSLTLPKGYYYRFRSQTAPPVSVDATVISTLASKFTVIENTLVAEHEAKITSLETTVTAHSASISDLENKYYLEYGINRNPGNDTPGYIDSDGSIVEAGAYWTTDFCYVGDLDEVICSCNAVGGTIRYAQDMAFLSTYDENQNFIERVYTTGSSTYTVEEGVAFVRFCIDPTVIENVMLQGGNIFAPSFVPYIAPKQKLKPQYYNSGSNWSDKKWIAVGDSITEYNSKADKHYHDYINEATGINVVNMGASGTGYKRTEDESKAFYQRILNAPTDADVVTIFGSGNDLNYSAMGFSTFAEALGSPTDSGTSTICGCINQTIANLYSIMPTVQLGIVTPNPWESYNPSNVDNDMDLYSNAIIEICKLHGIPCLDLYHCSNMRPWDATYRTLCYSNDGGYGVHPNDLGHKILAPHFKAFLNTLLI